MSRITDTVGNALKAPLLDRTGITGSFDLHVRYVPEDRVLEPNMEPGPSLAKALQEELGLTLQKGTGPIEVLVIDHLEKPSEN